MRSGAERVVQGSTVLVAVLLGLTLLSWPAFTFVHAAWSTVAEGVPPEWSTIFSFALVAAVLVPHALAWRTFRTRRRAHGRDRLTAAVPASLVLFASAVVVDALLIGLVLGFDVD